MRYLTHEPVSPLRGSVEYFWSLHDAPLHARERIIPAGTIELVVNLAADRFHIHHPDGDENVFPGAIVSGCYSAPFGIETRDHASIVGVHFKPGGAARLLGAPAGALADAHVALEDLWGRGALELREQLCSSTEHASQVEILQQALLARLADARESRDAVKDALCALERPGISIGELTKHLGLSRRRLIEIFTEDVGMTPKRYAKVQRFRNALARVTPAKAPRWSELALASGYYDQAHLYRDWIELTGSSPAELFALRQTPVKDSHVAEQGRGSNPSKTPRDGGRTFSATSKHRGGSP